MAEIDAFATNLLEEAKRFLEKASECSDPEGSAAYLHAALMLGFCALEAHVNAIASDFTESDLSLHEQSILFEKDVAFEEGIFKLSDKLKMWRLEDRMEFLHRRFSGKAVNHSAAWWSELKTANALRNQLTHPKKTLSITVENVKRSLRAIIDAIQALYKAVYRRKFPRVLCGLQSKLDF